MTDEHLDRLLKYADPYDADRFGDLRGGDLTLLEEIMSAPTPEEMPDFAVRRRQRSLRSRLVVGLAAASVLTVVAGGVAVLSPESVGGGQASLPTDQDRSRIVYSAAIIEAAEQNPRLLIDEPGWKATHVYGFAEETGTIAFSNAGRSLEFNWYPADQYDGYYQDRLNVSRAEPVKVDSRDGVLVRYSSRDFAVILRPDGGSFVELRTGIGGWEDKADLLAVLADVTKVDVDTWLAAMPPEIVTPTRIDAAAAEILADVPLPPGFDTKGLSDLGTNDRYQFGAQVSGRVVCGWIEEWQRASRSGDAGAARDAVAALQSSHEWAILDEMNAEGDYPEVVWEFADAIAAGTPIGQAGSPVEGYRGALGCQ